MPFKPFSTTNQPASGGRVKGSKTGPTLVPLLRKMLEKKLDYTDPVTKQLVTGTVRDVLLWRLLSNGIVRGDNTAIIEILDRVDGKVPQHVEGGSGGEHTKVIIIYPEGYKKKNGAESTVEEVSSRIH